VFGRRGPEHLAGELGRTVETMRGLAGWSQAAERATLPQAARGWCWLRRRTT